MRQSAAVDAAGRAVEPGVVPGHAGALEQIGATGRALLTARRKLSA